MTSAALSKIVIVIENRPGVLGLASIGIEQSAPGPSVNDKHPGSITN
jgi:hypothetical protein